MSGSVYLVFCFKLNLEKLDYILFFIYIAIFKIKKLQSIKWLSRLIERTVQLNLNSFFFDRFILSGSVDFRSS